MTDIKIGPTGEYPAGKLNATDEGQLNMGIGLDPKTGLIHLDFGTPTTWIAMPREQAIAMARMLLTKAGVKKVTIVL